MKCPICNGKGYVDNALGSFNEDCGHCQGTGKVRSIGEPMTNEEYIKSLNTEQLAEFIADELNYAIERVLESVWLNDGDTDRDEYYQRKSDVLEWLKEKHE